MALCVAIIGVGLMGASFGLAAKARGVARCVLGADRLDSHLIQAKTIGAIDEIADFAAIRSRADVIVIGTPVDTVAEIALHFEDFPGVITDLGSTKKQIVETIRNTSSSIRFCGSHPMAGSEKKGPLAARSDLFDGRAAILTPTDTTDETIISTLTSMWSQLGSRVVRMSASAHDETVAAVSHLPHAVAAALAACTDVNLLPLSAGGWRDTTRVAAAGSTIWTPIFRGNRQALKSSLTHFQNELERLKTMLDADDGDGLTAWLDNAKRVRDALGN